MSIWSTILLLLTILSGLGLWIYSNKNDNHVEINLLGIGSFALLFSYYLNPLINLSSLNTENTAGWSQIAIVSMSLALLANVLRKLKPSYAKYPVLFSFLPCILILVYPFISESVIIKSLLLQLTMGGGVISFMIMAIMLLIHDIKSWKILASGIFLSTSYVLEWFVPNVSLYHPWTVHVSLTLFMIFCMSGYDHIKVRFNH